MPFVNLTPHEINEVDSGTVLPSSGVARVRQCSKNVRKVEGIQIFRSEYEGSIQGLPEPQEGVIYIVSALTLNAVPADRDDVVAPGNAVRDAEGTVIGCLGLRCR